MNPSVPTEAELRATAVANIDQAFRVVDAIQREGREETPEDAERIQSMAVGAASAWFKLRHYYGLDSATETIREIEALGEMPAYLFRRTIEALMEDYQAE